jgi:hypothetical protein
MILPKTGATVALGIALLASTEALPDAAAVRRQEVSAASSGEWGLRRLLRSESGSADLGGMFKGDSG